MLVVTLMQRLVAGTTEKNSSLPESFFFLGSEVRSQHVQDLLQTKVFGRGNWLSG